VEIRTSNACYPNSHTGTRCSTSWKCTSVGTESLGSREARTVVRALENPAGVNARENEAGRARRSSTAITNVALTVCQHVEHVEAGMVLAHGCTNMRRHRCARTLLEAIKGRATVGMIHCEFGIPDEIVRRAPDRLYDVGERSSSATSLKAFRLPPARTLERPSVSVLVCTAVARPE
jgi:hypothetical protein